jgi:hypothetical protein
LEAQGIGEEEFQDMFADEMFTTTDSGGRTVELCEGGKNKPVTYENASEYGDAIASCRMSESTDVYAQMRRGMSGIIPVQLLSLFSWKQVETKVCGL